ncbi:ATP-binding protein [Hyunsoonleella flava]|uniref:ATP-binding protein n=1 Tax=Hyunsoonleella flava TaxID=2527939 RepID=A0A4Q9FFL8_9FLAO|nr:ATP-binding protein [Hyunsoonleella flava]TBN04441.1 ATP-binding protein [Hyunsoonleella flava]
MKTSYTALIFMVAILTISCNNKKKEKLKNVEVESETNVVKPSLEFLWETDSLLTTCEAVLFDKASQTIYVANVNNSPWGKDNNGFISTINTNGEITALKWAEGLSGPKGMGILHGKLYVNDIDRVVEIDLLSKKATNTFSVEDNPHLNDITVGNNTVFVSGSNSDAIYEITEGKITEVAKDSLGRLNGLSFQKEGMYYAASRSHNFGIYNKDDNTFKTLTTDIGHGDGIVRLENGDFIVSSWQGELFYIYSKDWTKTQLLDTRDKKINAADIDYIPDTQTLLVPTFFHNRVMAYKVKFE